MLMQGISQVFDNPMSDVFDEIGMTKVHQSTENEGGNDEHGQKPQRLKVLLGKNIVEHMLHQEWQDTIGGAKQHHADNSNGKTWEEIGPEERQQATVNVHAKELRMKN